MQKKSHSPDIIDWLNLAAATGVGPIIFQRLLQHFGTPKAVRAASIRELTDIDGIGQRTAERLRHSLAQTDRSPEIRRADALGVTLIHLQDSRYPPLLKRIPDPPPVLSLKGDLLRQDNLAVAIVGSRHCSIYGQEQAARLGHMLAMSGFTIVSGLARGIDTAAHQGALSAQGRTLAVQGCGLSRVFPPENQRLFEMVQSSGACISELPLDADPLPEHFPRRNRIIAGLSLGTVVIEAALRSGALITARLALDYNREVLAVPGRIDSHLSQGAHRLIKQGATLVESPQDIVDALGQIGAELRQHVDQILQQHESPSTPVSAASMSEPEQRLYHQLSKDPLYSDQLVQRTQMSAATVAAHLISLQLKGLVRSLPGNQFVKR